MPVIIGNLIVVLIVAGIVFLAVRAIWKNHKAGGCGGDCANCGGSCSTHGKSCMENGGKQK